MRWSKEEIKEITEFRVVGQRNLARVISQCRVAYPAIRKNRRSFASIYAAIRRYDTRLKSKTVH
jgi:hypothetical protein